MRLPVHDNDFQPNDAAVPPRWTGAKGSSWTAVPDHGFESAAKGDGVDWLRYRHLVTRYDKKARPELITDDQGRANLEIPLADGSLLQGLSPSVAVTLPVKGSTTEQVVTVLASGGTFILSLGGKKSAPIAAELESTVVAPV